MTTRDIIQAAAGVGGGEEPLYVEDVFSTYLYTGNGTSQTIQNGIALADGATSPGWIRTFIPGSYDDYADSLFLDNSGNPYISTYERTSNYPSYTGTLIALNSDGSIASQIKSTTTSAPSYFRKGVFDSTGNCIRVRVETPSQTVIVIEKVNSSGTVLWQRELSVSGNSLYNLRDGIVIDSNDNIYVAGYGYETAYLTPYVVKYNSSGTLQWKKILYTNNYYYCYSVIIDSQDDLYLIGYNNSNQGLIAKISPDSTLQWQKHITPSGGGSRFRLYCAAIDSNDNLLIGGMCPSPSSGDDGFVMKLNSSGVGQWQKAYRTSTTADQIFLSIGVDNNDDVFVSGSDSYSTGSNIIAKYSSSGSLLFARTINITGSTNATIYKLVNNKNGFIYLLGNRRVGNAQYDFFAAKLPDDGTGVGGYGDYVYEALSPTDITPSSPIISSSSLTYANSAMADASSSWGTSAAFLTSSLTEVPAVVGEGGLVWIKSRSAANDHALMDTDRGGTNVISSNSTAAQATNSGLITSFYGNGYSVGAAGGVNGSATTFASWTFRKAPKFFDIVTWTGDGTTGRAIAHNLDADVGFIVAKKTNGTGDWNALHRSIPFTGSPLNGGIRLNLTGAGNAYVSNWDNTFPTSTHFYVSDVAGASNATLNTSGETYVAYLFAHDAGGFGKDGTENVISCGSFTSDANGNATINLGYEPQWLLIKRTSSTGNWVMVDVMRGWAQGNNQNILIANLSDAELAQNSQNLTNITPTGLTSYLTYLGADNTYAYIAIRRGPMKVPTSGTEVYNALSRTGTGATTTVTGAGFPVDLVFAKSRANSSFYWDWLDRLRGYDKNLFSNNTDAEYSNGTVSYQSLTSFASMDGVILGADQWNGYINYSSNTYINYFFRRAPGFFDVVCYTGTSSATTVNHNLGVAPEMVIVKRRDTAYNWSVYNQDIGNTDYLMINTNGQAYTNSIFWNNTSPTDSVFTVGTYAGVNASGGTYVAYLFATVPGVSKVGSYTGTATTNQIDCGFSSGARFVLIKRTDSTGDWYVYDSARGIVAGNDPYLFLNSTAAEVTTTDYIDPYSAGFEISSSAPAAINASGGTYIFLAIA